MRAHCRERSIRSEHGATIVEVIAVFGLISIILGIAISNLRAMNKPLENAAYGAEVFLSLARSRAISGTQIVKVRPTSATTLGAFSGADCASATVPISSLTESLPSGTSIADTSWFVCFNPRGRADSSLSFNIYDAGHKAKTLKVALGGGIKVQK
jgi:hypothetical protein